MKHIRVAVGAAVETGVCGTVIIPGVVPTFGVGAVETGVCVVVKTPGVVAVIKEINLSGNCTHICFN